MWFQVDKEDKSAVWKEAGRNQLGKEGTSFPSGKILADMALENNTNIDGESEEDLLMTLTA